VSIFVPRTLKFRPTKAEAFSMFARDLPCDKELEKKNEKK